MAPHSPPTNQDPGAPAAPPSGEGGRRPELRLVAPFHASSGYSRHARALLLCCLAAGYRVQAVESDGSSVVSVYRDRQGRMKTRRQAIPMPEDAISSHQLETVRHALKTRVSRSAPTILLQLPWQLGAWEQYKQPGCGAVIGLSMVECDGLRPEVAGRMDTVDLLAAPSGYVAEVFRRHCRRPVEVLPDPVDPTAFSPEGRRALVPGRPPFLFGTVTTTHERKHWRELLHCFAEEFGSGPGGIHRGAPPGSVRPAVGLYVKTSGANDELDRLADACRAWGAWVKVDRRPWSDEDLAAWYRQLDCYVGVGHEGFGLPAVEAGLCGVPSVALSIGGQTDVVTPETGWLVPAVMAPCCGLYPQYFSSEFCWATCTVPALRQVLREVWETSRHIHFSGVLRAKGRAAREKALSFTPEALAPRLRAVVERAQQERRGRT